MAFPIAEPLALTRLRSSSSISNIMSLESEPKILGRGWTSIVSLYDTSTVLKGYQVWHNGQCHRSLEPDDFSKKSLDREDTVYQRLGIHPNILRYYGRVALAPSVSSLRFELAERGQPPRPRGFYERSADWNSTLGSLADLTRTGIYTLEVCCSRRY